MTVEERAAEKEALMTREELRINEKLTNEEYKIWKKGAPFMYNVLLVKALRWPSLTVQWLPDKLPSDLDNFDRYELLFGTHTSKADRDYVEIGEVDLPNSNYTGETSVEGDKIKKLDIENPLLHDEEVNTARYNPFNPKQIATGTCKGELLVFNRDTASSIECNPELRFQHHKGDLLSISWSPLTKNEILTSGDDHTVALWDITTQEPTKVLKDHSGAVFDVDYSLLPNVFGTASEDTTSLIYDKRDLSAPVVKIEDHENSVNSISFNKFTDTVFATGSSDTLVNIWDLRNTKQPIHTLRGHSGDVSHVAWSPHDASVLASAAFDRRVNIWDLSLISSETGDDEGPPELIFVHAGHTNKMSDVAWHPTLPWTLATASEDNVIQVWQMAYQVADYHPPSEEE